MTLPKHIQAEIGALEQRHAALAADRAIISADMLEIQRQIRLLKYRRPDPLNLSMPARPVDAASALAQVAGSGWHIDAAPLPPDLQEQIGDIMADDQPDRAGRWVGLAGLALIGAVLAGLVIYYRYGGGL